MKITLDTSGSIAEDTALVIGELVDSEAKHKPAFTPVSDELSGSGYGNFTVNHDGVWLFDLDNSHPEVQALAVNGTLTDTFEFSYIDKKGDIHYESIVLTITGTNDTPIAEEVFATIAEGTPLVIGELGAYDVDLGSGISYTPVSDAPSDSGFGNFTVNHDGIWLYDLHSDHPEVAALGTGETLTDNFEYTVTDELGASSIGTLSVLITGTDELPVVDGVAPSVAPAIAALDVVEANGADAPLEVVANDGTVVNLDAPTGPAAPTETAANAGAPPAPVEEILALAPSATALIEDDAAAAAAVI